MLFAAGASEENVALVGHTVADRVAEEEDVRGDGHDDVVAKDSDTQGGIDAGVLVEDRGLVGDAFTERVFEHHDTIAFRPDGGVGPSAIIRGLGHPDATTRVDVDVGRILDHRFGGEERNG